MTQGPFWKILFLGTGAMGRGRNSAEEARLNISGGKREFSGMTSDSN